MMDGIQPTIPIGGNDAFGGGSGIWLFAILALMWGGNGFFGGRGCGGNCATTEDLDETYYAIEEAIITAL